MSARGLAVAVAARGGDAPASSVLGIGPAARLGAARRRCRQQQRHAGGVLVRASGQGEQLSAQRVADDGPPLVLASHLEDVTGPGPAAVPGLSLDRDNYKEDARRFFRTVFGFEQWAAHRSTRRYWRHIRFLPSSRIVKGLRVPLLAVAGMSTLISAYLEAEEAGILPKTEPFLEVHSALPSTLTSFALALLLVFRTNASYSRWLDARKAWGLLVNRSRDLNRVGLCWMPETRPELLDMLARWTVAFARSLMAHLRRAAAAPRLRCLQREEGDAEGELAHLLPQHELEALLAADHRPNYCLQVLTQVIKASQIERGPGGSAGGAADTLPMSAAFRMDEAVRDMEDIAGTCERLLRTPIPISYTRHTSRFMVIWLGLLPFSLWDTCRFSTIPITVIISFLLLGIEEIGVSIEEPFSILPLEFISATIEKNVLELHGMHGPCAPGAARRMPSAADLVAAAEEAPWQRLEQEDGGLNGAGSSGAGAND
eukprot:scaffold12.g8256.t1